MLNDWLIAAQNRRFTSHATHRPDSKKKINQPALEVNEPEPKILRISSHHKQSILYEQHKYWTSDIPNASNHITIRKAYNTPTLIRKRGIPQEQRQVIKVNPETSTILLILF